MKITDDIKYVGVNDREIDLFEGLYEVPNGIAYNSYIIEDEKIAIFDTVEFRFGEKWLHNIKSTLNDKTPSYLIIQHMEPDHSSNIALIMKEYPSLIVVSTDKTFVMMKQFFGEDYPSRRIVIKDSQKISLGKHTLTFIGAPMVHWPEVFVTYDSYDKVLFSADAFGKFGALDTDEDWACEARRYYFGIVGKYGAQVQRLLSRASSLEINIICPLHGPVLAESLEYYLRLYDIWSKYEVESEGALIAYTSVYGNTKKAVELLERELKEGGCPKVVVADLARCDMSEAIEDAFRYGKIVLATTTYNTEIFPPMREFLTELIERNYQNREVAIIENGSWAPTVAKKIKELLQNSKNLKIVEPTITIHSAMSEENRAQISALARELL